MNEVIDNNEDEVEHEVIFANRSNRDKIYIPVILRIEKDKFSNYEYVKSIDTGTNTGHILKGNNGYFMCLSKDDCVSTDKKFMEPLGYRREKLEDLEKLAETFKALYLKEQKKPARPKSNKYPMVVIPPILDSSKEWHIRMQGQHLINVKTKQKVALSDMKNDVSEITRLSIHMIDAIIRTGILVNDWCIMTNRIDGQSWEDYLSREDSISPQTQSHHSQQ